MTDQQPDHTLKEILEEDKNGYRKKRRVGSFFVRLLLTASLLFVGFYGFILFRQWRLNLEAEAIVTARQTASASSNGEKGPAEDGEGGSTENSIATTPESIQEETPGSDFIRTETVAVEMTSVAEFQQTSTPN